MSKHSGLLPLCVMRKVRLCCIQKTSVFQTTPYLLSVENASDPRGDVLDPRLRYSAMRTEKRDAIDAPLLFPE